MPTMKDYPPAPIDNPQIRHAEGCHFRSEDDECGTPLQWRGIWGYCSCMGYPQVMCRFCGAVVDEKYEVPTGDPCNDDERIITQHVCGLSV